MSAGGSAVCVCVRRVRFTLTNHASLRSVLHSLPVGLTAPVSLTPDDAADRPSLRSHLSLELNQSVARLSSDRNNTLTVHSFHADTLIPSFPLSFRRIQIKIWYVPPESSAPLLIPPFSAGSRTGARSGNVSSATSWSLLLTSTTLQSD